jgi:hypothetical protein
MGTSVTLSGVSVIMGVVSFFYVVAHVLYQLGFSLSRRSSPFPANADPLGHAVEKAEVLKAKGLVL